MNRSGIKRGLAMSAVSALAVSGLALAGPAMAQTIAEGEGAGFEFYSQVLDASTRFDGVNSSVTLFAGVGENAGVNSVRFSYLKGATAVEIAEVAPLEGVAESEWTPPGGAEGAAITGVRAEFLDINDVVVPGGSVDRPVSPATATGMGDNAAINLAGGNLGRVGLGPDGEIVVRGSATQNGLGNIAVQNVGPSAAGGAVNPTSTTAPDGNNVSQFVAVVPVAPGNNTADAEDQIVVRGLTAGAEGSSDDVNAYTLYNQVITTATAPVNPSFPASVQAGGANDETRYNITVLDQEGQPVQGADVFEVANQNPGALADGSGNGTPNSGETNTNGQFSVSLFENDIDGANDRNPAPDTQTTYYVVDVNQNGQYDDGTDFRFTLTQTRVAAVPTSVVITSSKGTVLDDDETTNVTVTVRDQNGQPIANRSVVLSGVLTDEDDNPPGPTNIPNFAATTNAQGQITLANLGNFPGTYEDGLYTLVLNAFVNNNGTPVFDDGDVAASPVTLTFDTTSVVWDSGSVAQAQNGTTTVQRGRLVQDSTGDALGAGRNVAITYNPGGNSILAPQAQQPAGTVRGSATQASANTAADGSFSVAVQDPAVPNGQELGSTLFAEAPALESGGDSTDGVLTIDFLRSIAPAVVRIINVATGDQSDGLAPGLANPDNELIPGGLGLGTVEVENADGVELTDVEVDLTIEEGFFVDLAGGGATAFEPTPAPGAPVDFASSGQSITITTNDGGGTLFAANIERNEGFDDDGLVDDGIRATAGSSTDSHDLTWTTNATPLNPRATNPLVVELSDGQESTLLPRARAGNPGGSGQVVDYDVETFDQFGNRTSQPTTVTDNTPLADFFTTGSSEFDLTQPAVQAFANQATNQVIEVELDGSVRNTYADNVNDSSFDPTNPAASINQAAVQVEEETDAINWYDLDVANSTFSLTQQGAQNVPVGTTVTMVFTARDQEGQPIQGLFVDFLRAGPGNEDDDSCNEDVLNNCQQTDANGQAFLDFAGGQAGNANITVIGYEDDGTRIGTLATDTVTFGGGGGDGGGDPVRSPINPALKGKSQGNKDILTVRAKKANGAKVTLFKIVNNRRVRVATGTLNSNGVKRFAVRDTNGNRFSAYQAVVAPTSDTRRGTTQRRTLR